MEQWSRGDSTLHRLDPRTKLLAILAVLIFIATAAPWSPAAFAFYGGVLIVLTLAAGLPVTGLLGRAALVLPFSVAIAGMAALTGDTARATSLLSKSLLSALAVVLLMATTPVPALAAASGRLGVPSLLVTVVQFLYRYLFVLFDRATRMRQAMLCRGGFRWTAAAGAVAALFASSYGRAERIHMAMLARGYDGAFQPMEIPENRIAAGPSAAALTISIAALIAGRMLWGF